MNMTHVDAKRREQDPIMGCYGIGVGRLAASVCEAHHDEYGPIWPESYRSVAGVHLCAVRVDDEGSQIICGQAVPRIRRMQASK